MDTYKKNERNAKIFKWMVGIFLAWFLFTFIIYPIFSVLINSFVSEGQFDLSAVQKVVGSDRAMGSIKNSFLLAVSLTLTVHVIGLFLCLVTEYFDIKGASFLKLGYMTPLVMGGLVMNYGYLLVYGQNGLVTKILMQFIPGLEPTWFEGYGAVLFVMSFGCTHIHMLFLRNAIRGIDYSIIEAAKNLGSSQFQILKNIVIPTTMPVMITLIIITFQTGLGAFAAPVMVGGRDFQTISPMILTFANRPQSRDIAAVLSVVLGIFQIILLYLLTKNEKNNNYLSISKTRTQLRKQKISNPIINGGVHLLAYLVFIVYALPFLALLVSSFMEPQAIRQMIISPEFFTVSNYLNVFSDMSIIQPLLTSIIYAALAALGSVMITLIFTRILFKNPHQRLVRGTEYIFYIPWLIPSLMLALGYILAYDHPTALLFGQTVIGSIWILPLAYLVSLLPNTLRYMKGSYYSIDNHLEDASRMLGANSWTTFRKVIIPTLLPTILALLVLNFNVHIDDYDLSVFLYQPSLPTLGIEIRQNANPNYNVNAQAINSVYSVIVILIKSLAIYFVYGRGTEHLSQDARKIK